jgi:RimJ/RimL family protein N-acetyltransferase
MTNRTVFLTTKQTDLVQLIAADAAVVLPWLNNHRITQYLSRGDRPVGLEEEEKFLTNLYEQKNKIVLGIWHRETDKLIGMTGLHLIDSVNQTASFGIMIGDESFHAQGVGSEVVTAMCTHAFNWLNLRNVKLDVLGSNPRAVCCYQRCGFYEVGRYPEHIFKNGVWVDEIHMLVRRDDFKLSHETETKARIAHIVQQSVPEVMK